MLSVKVEAKGAVQFLKDLDKQTRFATAVALTRTAKVAKEAITAEIGRVFDRPTPFTMNSLYMKGATPKTLTAEVGIKDSAAKAVAPVKWLAAQVHGGARLAKRSEERLRRAGVMYPNEYAVPGQGAQLDQYGNMSRGQLQAILSDMQAHWDHSQNSTSASRAKRAARRNAVKRAIYFSPRQGSHLHRGVYRRIGFAMGSEIRPVLIFVQGAPRYSKRLRFYEIATKVFDDQYAKQFDIAFKEAMATAHTEAKRAA